MQPITEKKIWTDEELMAMPEDGNNYELLKGELVISPTGALHEHIGGILLERLNAYVRNRKLGAVWGSSVGFKLQQGTVLSSDLSFVAKINCKGSNYRRRPFRTMHPILRSRFFLHSIRLKDFIERSFCIFKMVQRWFGSSIPMNRQFSCTIPLSQTQFFTSVISLTVNM